VRQQHAGRAQHMAGMVEASAHGRAPSQARHTEVLSRLVRQVQVAVALQLLFVEKRSVARAAFLQAATLQAGRGGQQQIGKLARDARHVHQHVRKLAQQDRQRPDVVVMRVRDDGVIDVPVRVAVDQLEARQALGSFLVRIDPHVEHESRPVQLHEIAVGPDRLGITQRDEDHLRLCLAIKRMQ